MRRRGLPTLTHRAGLGASLRAPSHSMAKHMLTALTRVLARALEDTPILVNAVDPRSTATHPVRSVAETAQRILLRPPPRRIGPLRVAWLYLAAE